MTEEMTRKERKRIGKKLEERRREFMYKGYTLEQLRKMSIGELIKILPARARRSLKRGFSEEQEKFLSALRDKKTQIVKTHRRDMVILPEFVGRKIGIHRGNEFKIVEILPEMIGHFLGEFALTRKFIKHAGPGVGATRSSKFLPLK
ncbi:MAG: 30S ribosomal protein S19 [Candidatus Thermoplasmatota archaeon]